jgi:hypothetical protein
MPIRIEAYTADGILAGTIASPGHLRDALESAPQLPVAAATFSPLDGRPPSTLADVPLVIDEVIVATSDEALPGPIHAVWHDVVIEAGPYRIEGELATLPGFDPGRALTRPTGEFVHLRDVSVALLDRPEAGRATHPEGLVNRYLVDMVESDIMLGFFFPGARMEGPGAHPLATTPPAAHDTAEPAEPSPEGAVATDPAEAAVPAVVDAASAGAIAAGVGQAGPLDGYPTNGSAAAPTA